MKWRLVLMAEWGRKEIDRANNGDENCWVFRDLIKNFESFGLSSSLVYLKVHYGGWFN